IFLILAGAMAACYIVGHIFMVKGKMVEVFDDEDDTPAGSPAAMSPATAGVPSPEVPPEHPLAKE
ncbi:MAG: hypothetical protein ACSLFD_00085, partial [Solirubrobacterales bacterium]